MKKTYFLLRILVFLLVASFLTGAVPQIPLKPYPGAKSLSGDDYFDYNELKIRTDKRRKDTDIIVGGKYWSRRFKHKELGKDEATILNYYKEQVKQQNGKETFSTRNSYYFIIDQPNGRRMAGYIWSNEISHNIEVVIEAPMEQKIHFGGDTPFTHQPRMKIKIPDHSIIRPYKGSVVTSTSKYFKYRDLKLQYKENGQKKVKIIKGNNWQYSLDIIDSNGKKVSNISALAIIKNLKVEVERLQGKVFAINDKSIVFMIPGANGSTWGKAWANNRGHYVIEIVDEGAFKQTLTLNVDQMKQAMDQTGAVTLQGVYFDNDKATLKDESKQVLNNAFQMLNRYKDLKVEVAGHTDNTGGKKHNLELSRQRAESVKTYLVSKGINAGRLTAKGYGDSQPVASNDSQEGRSKNRRVELVNTAIKKKKTGTFELIKPFPRSKEHGKRTIEKNSELEVFFRDDNNKRIAKTVHGDYTKISYRIKDSAGKVVRDVSKTEIKQNYINEVKRLGGDIYFERGATLIFTLKPDGSGTVWVKMWITDNGYYSIEVLKEK